MQTLFLRLLLGLIGGIVATGPMTMAMLFLHKRLPSGKKHPLPPREITSRLTRSLGFRHKLSQDGTAALTLLNHFGYGGAAGISYAAAMSDVSVEKALIGGPLYGLLVWALSYLGLLPGFSILKPATRHAAERNVLMIAAHLVWGLILAGFVAMLMEDRRERHGTLVSLPLSAHRDTA